MSGVVLAIAFLAYMLVTDNVATSLAAANVDRINVLLQRAGVDILRGPGTDSRTLLLIGLSLLACLVGIVNAMLMSVTERTKEIGTMKCLGARSGFILQTYFIEAVLQGILGALAGLAVGALVAVLSGLRAYGAAVLEFFPARAVLGSLAVSFAVGFLISVMAAIAPAAWAAAKEPVDAMRVEE
jgi:ABC-type lipoprotein release transport system permease subunit